MKKLLLLISLVGCKDYTKPFSVDEALNYCSGREEVAAIQNCFTHLEGSARVVCLNASFRDAQLVDATRVASSQDTRHANFSCEDRAKVIYCSAYYVCVK